jgi:hypothetical protein
VSAINSARLFTAQIHLLAMTAGGDGVSYRFGSTLYSTDSLTRYKSQRSWRQISILYSTESLTRYNSQRGWCQLSIQLDSL